MSLIAMAVHDTVENKRTELTKRTLECLFKTVNLSKHRIFVIDNGSCTQTKQFLKTTKVKDKITLITNEENIGTAEAINLAWKQKKAGENCIKIDNDVLIHSFTWVEEMEEAIQRDTEIGIIGLKRKDIWEEPKSKHGELYNSELYMLPHEPYQRWIVAERVRHVIGTCQMYNAKLLEKIGYLYQPTLYGFDDVLAAFRCNYAGMKSVFLPHINIDHIDVGGDAYSDWKRAECGKAVDEINKINAEYQSGRRSIYYEGNFGSK